MSTPRAPGEWQAAAARLRVRGSRKRTARKVEENGKLEENLGPALRWLRLRRYTTQQEIAESAGITRPMVSAYERGKVKPTLDTLEGILAALGCDLGQLAGALKIVAAEMPAAVGETPRTKPTAEPQAFDAFKQSVLAWLDAVREDVLYRGGGGAGS